MRIRRYRRRILQFVFIVGCVLFGPYVYSRIFAASRCVAVNQVSDRAAESSTATITMAGDTPGTAKLFSIAAYNIAHGRGLPDSNWQGGGKESRLARLQDIADLLQSIDADVVVLNEVDFDCSWSHHVNQAEFLAQRAGYPYVVEQRNLDFRVLGWTWRFGNAILSKYPIQNARVVPLPAYATWESVLAGHKQAVACEVDLGDRLVRVIGAHLSPRSESLRVQSCESLLSATTDVWPCFVVGDFNSSPPGFPNSKVDPDGRNAIRTMDRHNNLDRLPANLPSVADYTFPSSDPKQVIDWLFYTTKVYQDDSCGVTDYAVVKTELSDHRPVRATFSLPQSKQR